MKGPAVTAALDIGSTSVKAVAAHADGTLMASLYSPIRGRLRSCLQTVVGELSERIPCGRCSIAAVTGSSAASFANDMGVRQVNEIIAAHLGATRLVPGAGAALELGGEHSTLLRFGDVGLEGGRDLRDFAINSVCSAGTGAFLEQEAHRLEHPFHRGLGLVVGPGRRDGGEGHDGPQREAPRGNRCHGSLFLPHFRLGCIPCAKRRDQSSGSTWTVTSGVAKRSRSVRSISSAMS